MIRALSLLLFTCFVGTIHAKTPTLENLSTFNDKIKIIESDKRKKPKWINTVKKDYIIVVGSGSTVESSQENAILKVKENIVKSVAENVKVTTEVTSKEAIGSNVNYFFQSFEQTTQAQTADLNFIKGISLSKAEDYWWEKVKDANNIIVYYYLLYPFSDVELHKLVMAFEKADRELTEQLHETIESADRMDNIEDLESAVTTLEKLKEKFLDNRKTKSEIAIEQLKAKLASINIVPVYKSLGEIEYQLKSGNTTITTKRKPRAVNPSKCATVNGIEPTTDGWKITFDAKYCYSDPKNFIKVEHNCKYAKISHDFYFDINEGKVEIFMNAPIMISSTKIVDNKVVEGKVTFTVTNKFDGQFSIDRIVLNYAKNAPIVFDNINRRLIGKGNHSVVLELPSPIDKDAYSSKVSSLVDGMIYYNVQGEQRILKLYQNTVNTTW